MTTGSSWTRGLATRIAGGRGRTIVFGFVGAYLAIYLPLFVSTTFLGYYPHLMDTTAVLLMVLSAVLACGWVARVKLPWYEAPEGERSRENRGWTFLALGSLLVLVPRAVYGVNELTGEPFGSSIPILNVVFGSSFIFLVAGLVTLPWSSTGERANRVIVDAGIVLVVVFTLLWPLLIGPVATGEFTGSFSLWTVLTYLVGIFVLSFSALWLLMRGVRPDLWLAAISLALSAGTMVLIQVGYLAFLVTSGAEDVPLLFVNAMTSASFLLIAMAAVLRLQATGRPVEQDGTHLASPDRPVHRWQIVLPFPLIGILLVMRLGMEAFDWRTDYAGVMVVGSIFIVAMMMYRQYQLLRHNERLYRRVAGAAIRDGLTGLYNHRAMHELLHARAVQADRSDGTLAVLFLDIDRFKHYNDTYGHRQGDGLLTSISEILTNEARGSDIVGRYGGEEFMVIAPDTSPQEACALAERLRSTVERQKYVHNGTRSSVTVSIGIAVYPHDAGHPEQLVERADEAMYRAKAGGRNRTVLYCPA